MREPARDWGRLEHILEAIGYVESFTEGFDCTSLVANLLHLHATTHNIQIIGEAVYKLSSEFKDSHPETPWAIIEKMRHILVHDYYQIDFEIMWDIIQNDLPVLKRLLRTIFQRWKGILSNEYITLQRLHRLGFIQ